MNSIHFLEVKNLCTKEQGFLLTLYYVLLFPYKVKEIEFLSILDKFGHDRLRVRLKIDKGELIDVVYQYEAFINEKWVPIVRYDCAHGFFHRDILNPNGDKEKQEIIIDNLKSASKHAEQDLKDRWEWYKDRYIKKIKKTLGYDK